MSKQHFVIVCIINDGFADEAMDISTDITVLEGILAQEGLTGSDFKGTKD